MDSSKFKTNYSILVYLLLEENFGGFGGEGYLKKQCQNIGVDPFEINDGEINKVAGQMRSLFVSLGRERESTKVRNRIMGFLVLDDPNPVAEKKLLKARLLIDVAEFYFRGAETKDMAGSLFDEALELLEGEEDAGQLFRVYKWKGDEHTVQEHYEDAISEYTLALENSVLVENKIDVYMCWLNLGNCYWRKANHTKAREIMQKCVDFAKKMETGGDREKEQTKQVTIATSYNVLGNVEVDLGDYANAITNLEHAKNIYHKLGDKSAEGLVYNNLGTAYDDMPQHYLKETKNKWTEAIKQYEKGIELLKLGKTPKEKGYYVRILGNASRAYSWLGKMPRSKQLLEEANEILKEIEDKIEQVNMLKSIVEFGYAVHYQNRRPNPKYDAAIQYYQRSIEKAEAGEARDYLHRSYHELGKMYMEMGKKEMAEKYLNLARKGYEEDGQTRRIAIVQKDMDSIS